MRPRHRTGSRGGGDSSNNSDALLAAAAHFSIVATMYATRHIIRNNIVTMFAFERGASTTTGRTWFCTDCRVGVSAFAKESREVSLFAFRDMHKLTSGVFKTQVGG
jgi:hypothetical protein